MVYINPVGFVAFIVCIVLIVVLFVLTLILCYLRLRRRLQDQALIGQGDSRDNQDNLGDEPPDYYVCAENYGFSPDNNSQTERDMDIEAAENCLEPPPSYDTVLEGQGILLDPTRLEVDVSSQHQKSKYESPLGHSSDS